MSSSKPRLTYFNGRGLGEFPRLVLAQAGVDYEDNRVDDIKSLKEEGVLPFGQVPLYQVNGVNLVQSVAIARYIGATNGLYGSNPIESAQIDAIIDGISDIRGKFNLYRALPESEQAAYKTKTVAEAYPQWIGYFENILAKNNKGQGWLVGDKVSIADIAIYNFLFVTQSDYPDVIKNAPLLQGLVKRVSELPKIAAWLKKRPVSAW